MAEIKIGQSRSVMVPHQQSCWPLCLSDYCRTAFTKALLLLLIAVVGDSEVVVATIANAESQASTTCIK